MMRFIKHNLTAMDGVAKWPLISLLIFFLFFLALGIHVWRMRKSHVEDMSNMPLTDDDEGAISPRPEWTRKKRGASHLWVLLLFGLHSKGWAAPELPPVPSSTATHLGMADDLWLLLLLGGAALWTAMILATMSIFKNLAEHRGRKGGQLKVAGWSWLISVFVLSDSTFWGLIFANGFLVAYLLLMLRNVHHLATDLKPKRMAKPTSAPISAKTASKWSRIWQILNGHKSLAQEEDMMLHHAYDGIRELDNRLPPWWLYGFYLSIFAAVVYLFNFHVFQYQPLSAEAYERQMTEAAAQVDAYLTQMALQVDEHSVELQLNDERIGKGRNIFAKHCVACHAGDGGGGVGPNLADDYWLHGSTIADVFKTVKYGVPSKGMRSWKTDLTPMEIQNVSTFILSLQGTHPLNPKSPQGVLSKADAPPASQEGATDTAQSSKPLRATASL